MRYLIILIIIILIIIGCLWLLYKWYKQEQQEQDERILQLEKRIEDYRREEKKAVKEITIMVKNINDNMNVTFINLQKQLKKKSDKNE